MSARFYGALAGLAFAAAAATAQPAQNQQGGAMQGLQLNRDQPVKIESDALEVRDKSQQATFIGKVKLTQGDTILQCQSLVIFYEDSSAPTQKKGGAKNAQKGGAAGGGLGGGQNIKRAEAKGDVLVTQKDQTAKGEVGIFDVKSNTVTLTGNVVVTQGTNVLRGDRMVVDLTTGVSRVESNEKQRVEGLFNPSSTPQPQAQPAPPPPPAPAPQKDAKGAKPAPAKQTPGGPIRIN
jgi:lipopolysaccharide export system protein LptA